MNLPTPKLLLAALVAACAVPLSHAVNLTSVYTQNFDGLGTAGTAAPTDWTVHAYTVGANTTWAASIPEATVGNAGAANATLTAATAFTATSATQGFNYALSTSTSDRALGVNPTSSQGMALQLTLTNATGAPLPGVRVSYDIRRLAVGSSANELPGYWLFYSIDGGANWTNVAALNPTLAGPAGVVVPNTTGVTSVPLTAVTFASPVANGANIIFRWIDDNASQSSPDQVCGLDNVVVAPALSTPGKSALWFDGVNDYVTMGAATALGAGGPPSNGFTIECWFRKEGTGVTSSSGTGGVTGVPLFGKGRGESENSNVDCDYFFGIDAAGHLVADFEAYPASGITAGQNYPVTGTHAAIVNNTWYHAAATYDGATTTWRLYLNGAPAGTATAATNALPRYDSIQHFGIGAALNSTGTREGAFAGRIDEVRVWNYARSAAEILAGRDAEIATAPGLIGRYGLDEGTGLSAANSPGAAGAPVGTLTSGPVWIDGPSFVPNVPPTVALTAPPAGGNAIFPATVDLAATATDNDGTISQVEFYDGATKLGEDLTAPYTYAWTAATVGSHTLSAKAYDNSGGSVISATAAFEVLPNPNQPTVVTPAGPANNATGLGDSTTLDLGLADGEGDALTVTYYGRNTTPAVPAANFSIIAIPDTQFYSENINSHSVGGSIGANAAFYYAQTQWIADNQAARKIAFVTHMGDIAQNGDTNQSEWIVADTAMKIIENPAATLRAHGIPWGVAPGNHDQGTTGNGDAGAQANFYMQYFNFPRFDSRPYYGGHFGTKSGQPANTNSYQLFSAGGLDFIIIHMEYDIRAQSFFQPVLDWADALLKAYPNRRAIVTSHWIVNTGNPATFSTQGQAIYNTLKNNPNLFLMLCGHVNGEGIRSDTFNGHTVYSVLQDYQEITNGGNGFLRIYTFSPANNTITLESYSPVLNRAVNAGDGVPQGNNAAIVLPYNMQAAVTDWIPLGTVSVPTGGTSAPLPWTGLEAGQNYEWYATVSDGVNTTTTATSRFSTATNSAPTVTLDAPLNGDTVSLPAIVTLAATATDADNNIAKVEFFDGGVKLGEVAAAPYAFAWTSPATGPHALTAVVTDSTGLDALSNVATITVTNPNNLAPTVVLTAPVDGSSVVAGSSVALAATAADTDGTVTKVEFYLGATKLGQDANAPHTFTWSGGPVGNYTFTAVATDSDGAATTSNPVTITVIPVGAFVSSYTQDFTSLGTAGTAVPAAWSVWLGTAGSTNSTWSDSVPIIGGASSVANSVGTMTKSTAALTASSAPTATNNNGYNAAEPGNTANRLLATSPTSTNGSGLQLDLTNISPAPITAIRVAYDIRRFTAVGTANELPGYWLFYSLDNGLTWTNVPALNPTLTGAGVTVPNTVGVTAIPATLVNLPSSWAVGGTLQLRWVDDNAVATSPDQIVGLDNVSVTAVTIVGAPPAVSLTSPLAGASYSTSTTIPLAATATDSDGNVAKVEFYNGGTKLGEAIAAPFTYNWTGAAVGSYTLTAVATDNVGNLTASTPVGITVSVLPGSSGALLRGPYLNLANQNSIVVRWRSSLSTVGRVRYGSSPDALDQFTDEAGAKTDHEVRLSGLSPLTRYYYSVGSAVDSLTPETADTTTFRPASVPAVPSGYDYTFRTSPVPGIATPTRVWVVGDCGRGSTSQASGRDAYYTWMGTRVPDLNLQLGDNAYNSGTDTEYQTGYFLMYPSLFRKMPQWSTLGNHDANNGVTDPSINFPYFDMFTFPKAGEAGGVASGTEHYYSFDYGNIHFISLDSQASLTTVDNPATPGTNEDGPMAAWLRQDLAATTATWIIAFFHHPPYSKGSHDSDTEGQMVNMRARFNPLLEAGGVDLVLTGHSHNYERSVLLDGNYGITSTITPSMKLNAGNGSTTGFTTGPNGIIRNAANGFTAVATVNGTVIPPDGAYLKPLTGPRDHFGAVYNTAGMSGQADGGSLNHSAMYISYNSVGTVNLDIDGNTLVATYVQAGGTAPDNYTIVKQGAADSDHDGIPDDYEIANGLDRKNAADAGLDLDGDGLANRLEYYLGTAANQPGRIGLPVLGTADAGKLTLTFNRVRADLTYTVQASDDLKSWTDLAINPGTAGSPVTVTDANTTSPNRFLRLRVTDGSNPFTTTPVGRLTYALAQNQETAVSFPLHTVMGAITGQPAGFITAVGASTLDNANAGWAAGLLSQAATPYLVHLTSGAASGLVFPVATVAGSENTATRLTLATGGIDLTTLGVVPGTDTYQLLPADTLADLFPTGTLQSGTSTTADTLRVWNGTIWLSYYHDGANWRQVGGGLADDTLVRPDQGWMLLRRGPARNLVLLGEVLSTNGKVPVLRGASSYVSLLPVAQTFAEYPLQTLLPGWSSNAANPTAGDYVRLWNGTAWLNYYYNGTKWMRQGAGDASTTVLLKPGRPLFIVRPAGTGNDFLLQTKTY